MDTAFCAHAGRPTPNDRTSARWRRRECLGEAFLEGQNLPVAKDEWRVAADHLGANVRPILDFLRAFDAPM
jgi:hypothetical protein